MNANGNLSENTILLVIEKLKEDIETHKAEIAKTEQAILELTKQRGGSPAKHGRKRRLAAGMPRKLVIEALKRYGDLTMAELRRTIASDTGHTIKDGSARRALERLIDEGKIKKDVETNAYEYITK